MKHRLLVVSLVWVLFAGTAEASVGSILGNIWQYATTPVPCLFNLGADVLGAFGKFATCFLGNMNPAKLIP